MVKPSLDIVVCNTIVTRAILSGGDDAVGGNRSPQRQGTGHL